MIHDNPFHSGCNTTPWSKHHLDDIPTTQFDWISKLSKVFSNYLIIRLYSSDQMHCQLSPVSSNRSLSLKQMNNCWVVSTCRKLLNSLHSYCKFLSLLPLHEEIKAYLLCIKTWKVRGKDMIGLSKKDLVIYFICAKLEVMDSALRSQRG